MIKIWLGRGIIVEIIKNQKAYNQVNRMLLLKLRSKTVLKTFLKKLLPFNCFNGNLFGGPHAVRGSQFGNAWSITSYSSYGSGGVKRERERGPQKGVLGSMYWKSLSPL